ncbi:MAG: HPr(Ser) kinase/phosphatase [candidate division Zixibacteria bacterium]|nr:HPr(Ser) kinase/phosphatase [candidate division Zixibacteria bacterium]
MQSRTKDSITVEDFYKDRQDLFELTLFTSGSGLKNRIENNQVHRPGLALAGFTERFAHKRSQILGETELTYLLNLESKRRMEVLRLLFSLNVPVVFITKGNPPPEELLITAEESNTPVLGTRLSTPGFTYRYSAYLDSIFAPRITVHGTLVDVYGVGLLYMGKSGVGKSECALDLVERGHRLVADDVVLITRKAPEVIIGAGIEVTGHHMEVRGIGIIDIEKLFGIRAIRLQKRIEVLVRLEIWDTEFEYDRLGIDEQFATILGIELPQITIPVSPGKNITVISEVIAMNHMLKVYGHNPALEFSKRLSEDLKRKDRTLSYLESDTE